LDPAGGSHDLFAGQSFPAAQGKVQVFGNKLLYRDLSNKVNLLYGSTAPGQPWLHSFPGSWHHLSPLQVSNDAFYGDTEASIFFFHQPDGSIAYNKYEACEVKKKLSNSISTIHPVYRAPLNTKGNVAASVSQPVDVQRRGAQLAVTNRSKQAVKVVLSDLVGRTLFTATLSDGEQRLTTIPIGICVVRTTESGGKTTVRKIHFSE
jgi:hypothetical protein